MFKIIKFIVELKLSGCDKNRVYVISGVNIEDEELKHRLKCFGFFINEKIEILNYNYGRSCYLVKVMGVNYAIDKKLCEGIIVSV